MPKKRLLVEFGIGQAESLASLAEESGFACQIHRDLGGRERVAELLCTSFRPLHFTTQ